MTLLLETTCSLGKLVMEQDPPPSGRIHVTIKRLGYMKQFSRDKVGSATSEIGKGSLIGLKTVTIHLPNETLVLKNVPSGPADYLASVLS